MESAGSRSRAEGALKQALHLVEVDGAVASEAAVAGRAACIHDRLSLQVGSWPTLTGD
jgi:hypothetical protein